MTEQSTILHTLQHPYDTHGILNWMLTHWQRDPTLELVVIVKEGEAEPLDNRLRVRLSVARKSLRASNERIAEFGFHGNKIPWETTDGKFEALCLIRFTSVAHHIQDSMLSELPKLLKD